jgi:hypothetical protein
MTRAIPALLSIALALCVAPVASAGTKMATNLGTPVPVCVSGSCNNGKAGTCSVDQDCGVGEMSASSKWAMDGKLLMKGSVKKVLDSAHNLVNTDGVLGSGDDYIFAACLRTYNGGGDRCFYVHVELKNGNGKIALNAGPLMGTFGLGTAIQLLRATFYAPPTSPGLCPGNNDATQPAFTSNQVGSPSKPDCETGGAVGVGGVVTGF